MSLPVERVGVAKARGREEEARVLGQKEHEGQEIWPGRCRPTVSEQGHAARFVTNSDFPAFKRKPPIFAPSGEIQNPITYHLNGPAWKQQINCMGTPRMGHK